MLRSLHDFFLETGTAIPPPRNMEVHISEDEVTVRWENPENAPSDTVYNFQIGRFVEVLNI